MLAAHLSYIPLWQVAQTADPATGAAAGIGVCSRMRRRSSKYICRDARRCITYLDRWQIVRRDNEVERVGEWQKNEGVPGAGRRVANSDMTNQQDFPTGL